MFQGQKPSPTGMHNKLLAAFSFVIRHSALDIHYLKWPSQPVPNVNLATDSQRKEE
jgi:hypothetical protein